MIVRLLSYLCVIPLVQALDIIPGKAFDRFITIWLENQDFDKANVDQHVGDLKKQGITLTRYFAQTHPSQPNYVAAISGDYFGLNHDEVVRIPQNISTVVDLLDVRDITWAGYFEDLPGPGYMAEGSDGSTGGGKWDYVRKHNPFVSFDSINKNGSRLWNIQSFMAFNRAFNARRVPQFVFMSPNMMNDGHNTTLAFSTSWSHNFVNRLLDEKAFGEKTLIMLTFDESEGYAGPNHIITILLGSAIPDDKKGTVDDTFYTHYSILSSIEDNWVLPHLGRYDVGANVFDFMKAHGAGFKNKEPPNAASVNNSVSYPGALHDEADKRIPFPPPNAKLTGVGGLPILDSVRLRWASQSGVDTPYDGSGNVYDGDRNMPVYKAQAHNS